MRLKYIQADMSTGVKEPVDDLSQKKSRCVDFSLKCIRLLLANWKMCSRIGIYSPLPPPPPQGCAGRSFFQRGGAGRGEGENPRGGAKVKILLIYEQRGSSITIVLVSKCRYFSTMKENFTA